MIEATPRQIATLALSLLDLTNLSESCTSQDVQALCTRAQTPYGHAAAVCIWPRFVAEARAILANSPIRIATVVNFPSGEESHEAVRSQIATALADGADEIDMVIPYRALLAGDEKAVSDMLATVREACGPGVTMKAILETGEIKDTGLIRSASHLAIRAGADFLKTSTGKTPVGATLEAADIMLTAIRESGRKVGFKPSGGVQTVAQARLYLDLAITIHGPDWVMPSTFRFGASSLLDDILAVIEGRETTAAAAGY